MPCVKEESHAPLLSAQLEKTELGAKEIVWFSSPEGQ